MEEWLKNCLPLVGMWHPRKFPPRVPDNAITPQCRICFSDKLKFLRVPPAELKTGAPASSSGSDDSSSVTSASMESDDAPGVVPMAKDEVIESSDDDKPLRGSACIPLAFIPPGM